jgi:limonene-1,2-epoxide hydrolase
MTALNYETPVIGEEFSLAAPKVDSAFGNILSWANGKIDSSNLKAGGVKEESLENGAISESKLSEAVQVLLGKTVSGLTFKESKVSMTAANGELVLMVTTGTTLTLPTPTANRVIGVFAGEGAKIEVRAVGASIIGDFENTTHATLLSQQHLMLQADGSNWLIIAGEPMRESPYSTKVERTQNVEYEVSARREAYVILSTPFAGSFKVYVGGVFVGYLWAKTETSGESEGASLGFPVGAGEKWKAVGLGNLKESHRLY